MSVKALYQSFFRRSINYAAITLVGAVAIGSIFDVIPNYVYRKFNQGILFEDVLAKRTAAAEDDE